MSDGLSKATVVNPPDKNLVNLTTVAYLHALEAKCAIQKEKIPAGQKKHNKIIMQVSAQDVKSEKVL